MPETLLATLFSILLIALTGLVGRIVWDHYQNTKPTIMENNTRIDAVKKDIHEIKTDLKEMRPVIAKLSENVAVLLDRLNNRKD